jgi:hypothetical protein
MIYSLALTGLLEISSGNPDENRNDHNSIIPYVPSGLFKFLFVSELISHSFLALPEIFCTFH